MMRRADERSGVERRIYTILNANLPYLTKEGRVLYDRRRVLDRRTTSQAEPDKDKEREGQ